MTRCKEGNGEETVLGCFVPILCFGDAFIKGNLFNGPEPFIRAYRQYFFVDSREEVGFGVCELGCEGGEDTLQGDSTMVVLTAN